MPSGIDNTVREEHIDLMNKSIITFRRRLSAASRLR
jgi:hypothetical protein